MIAIDYTHPAPEKKGAWKMIFLLGWPRLICELFIMGRVHLHGF